VLRPRRLPDDLRGDRWRAEPRVAQQPRNQSGLRREHVHGARTAADGGVSGGLEQRHEFFGRVGGRPRIVDGDEVHAASVGRPERRHQPEEIRVGLRVRAPQPVRDASDPDARRGAGRREDAQPGELGRQRVVHVQQHLAGAELRLVRSAIRLRELGMIGHQRVLHSGHFFGQPFECAAFLGRWRVAMCHGSCS